VEFEYCTRINVNENNNNNTISSNNSRSRRYLFVHQAHNSSLLVDGRRHPHVDLLDDVGTFFTGAGGGNVSGGVVVGSLVDVVGGAVGPELESIELAAIM